MLNCRSAEYAVDIATKPGIGQYLVNSTGWALYMYVPDVPNSGKSTCYGECANAWPIFYTSVSNSPTSTGYFQWLMGADADHSVCPDLTVANFAVLGLNQGPAPLQASYNAWWIASATATNYGAGDAFIFSKNLGNSLFTVGSPPQITTPSS